MGTTADKLTYLSGTKDKLKTAINYTGANITNDTFRSYADKLKLGYIDIINNGINTIYDNFPKVSGTGSNLSLTPTYEAPIKLNEIQGNTLQDGTPTPDTPVEIKSVTGLQKVNVCGKNLFDKTSITLEQRLDPNGLNYPDVNCFTSDYIIVKPNSTYVRNVEPSVYQSVCLYKSDKTFISRSSTTQTIRTTNDTKYIRLCAYNENLDVLQFEQGSTATTYEPYKGNTYEVNLGKNLLDISDITTTSYITNNGDGTITLNGTGIGGISFTLSTPFVLKANTTYTLSLTNTNSLYSNATFILRNGNSNIFQINYGQSSVSYTPTNDTTIDTLRIYAPNTITFNNFTFSIQLEKGSQATSYSEYFTPIELCKIDNYQDYIYKNNETWYKMPNVLKIESYNGETITTDYKSTTGGLDTGATIYYGNDNPVPIEITNTELINQLESLYNAKSHDGTTNISITSEDLPMILDVSALSSE